MKNCILCNRTRQIYWSFSKIFQTRYLSAEDEQIECHEHSEVKENTSQYCLLVADSNANEIDDNEPDKVNGKPAKSNNEKWPEYNIWLDCRITKANRFYYLIAMLLTALALLFGINLSRLNDCQLPGIALIYENDIQYCNNSFHHFM